MTWKINSKVSPSEKKETKEFSTIFLSSMIIKSSIPKIEYRNR